MGEGGEGLRRGWAHWASPRVSRGDFTEVRAERRAKKRRADKEQERCTQREQLVHCIDLFPQVTLREQTEQGSIGPGLG